MLTTRIPFRCHRHGALALLLTLAGGLGAPFTPVAHADPVPSHIAGTVELSPTPPNDTSSVPPNIVVTFDDSGSMAWDYMGDDPPFGTSQRWSGGPWYCAGVIDPEVESGLGAHVMNGVYYNPNVHYVPPVNADGSSFPKADASLKGVQDDGVTANRPLSPGRSDTTNFAKSWTCPYDRKSPVSSGPYYYKYDGPELSADNNGKLTSASLQALYKTGNWKAVTVTNSDLVIDGKTIKDADGNTVSQWQNWANWWAYYHDRNLMARTSLSRVFGNSSLATTDADGDFGSSIRVAWQNINSNTYKLPDDAIISSLVNTAECSSLTANPSSTQKQGGVTTPPDCYRSAFFNWIFQVGKNGGTPNRSAVERAGKFFQRGKGNNGGTGNLKDPYWQPPAKGKGDGNELTCRQNFQIMLTDGLWNGGKDGPQYSNLTLPSDTPTLPDGTKFPGPASAGVTSIYAPVHDKNDRGYASLSDIAFHYWATNLRSDLYDPDNGKYVPPYMPDKKTGVVTSSATSGSTVKAANVNNEVYFNPKNDPASWPHMTDYMIGLGVSGDLNFSDNTDCTDASGTAADACNLRKGTVNSSGSVGWPDPSGSGNGIAANIDDTWHAALAGRGQFFSAGNPQELVDQLSSVLSNISARGAQPTTGAVNASVLAEGALSFNTGYDSGDWSGVLQAMTLNVDGTTATDPVWDANTWLDAVDAADRNIFTASKSGSTGNVTGMEFKPDAAFDPDEQVGLMTPAPASGVTTDTLANRVKYLRGDTTNEDNGLMRKRTHQLGAIINSQPVYVSYPSSGYYDSWPAGSPEAETTAESYQSFVTDQLDRAGTLYVGANDGMLHAFDASLECNATDADGKCLSYGPAQSASAGQERWAYVPRAVYGNLGNLTSLDDFSFAPTVDGTPVVRDVFFDSNSKWHSLLVGGLRLGGRGIYALDVTDPEAMSADKVLWEFDADSAVAAGCVSTYGDCSAGDLGYTYGQPNVGRLANGKWVVIVPSGYFPDCSVVEDRPVNCENIAAASSGYSALFVLDAETGEMIAELKTPLGTDGVTSHGLSSPVLGDYNNDQIDDVAYAGDLAGNLWRFDLRGDPTDWSVALAYQPATADAQPITVMPRLFPDPATNRFMVVFGTGKYLGANDNTSTSAATQAIYGIRDELDGDGNPVTVTHDQLQAQQLTEKTIDDADDPNNGATLRALSGNSVSANAMGWYIPLDLSTAEGERVVVTPGAVFGTNTAVISTLIPGSSDPCNPTVQGAAMFIDATTGGPGSGLSSLGGYPYVGARVDNVRTGGTLSMVTPVGGGKVLLPGLTLTGKKGGDGGSDQPIAGDSPIWRRRAWSMLNNQP